MHHLLVTLLTTGHEIPFLTNVCRLFVVVMARVSCVARSQFHVLRQKKRTKSSKSSVLVCKLRNQTVQTLKYSVSTWHLIKLVGLMFSCLLLKRCWFVLSSVIVEESRTLFDLLTSRKSPSWSALLTGSLTAAHLFTHFYLSQVTAATTLFQSAYVLCLPLNRKKLQCQRAGRC